MPQNSLKERNDSLICCIFFCEFHDVLGPKITYQVPENYVSKEIFDALSVYLIPKNELHGRLITVNTENLKIIGHPVGIDGNYQRNRLIFNLCFVCIPKMRTVQYEPVVKKLAHYLINLERECGFIFKKDSKEKLPSLMSQIMTQLNADKSCVIPITESTTIYLKVARVQPKPDAVEDHDVPIFTTIEGYIVPSEWDLTTQQVLPHIDGYRHVAKIAQEADVEVSLVKACIQNMIYYDIVSLIPIFQYSNVYVVTSSIVNLIENTTLRRECIEFVHKVGSPVPTFRSIFQFYCSMTAGVTVKDLCIRFNPGSLGIDERKLVRFGSMKGLIRRLQKYPVFIDAESEKCVADRRGIYRYFDGNQNYDKICTLTGKTVLEVEEKVDKHPAVVVCWK